MNGNQKAYNALQTTLNIAGAISVSFNEMRPGFSQTYTKPSQNSKNVHTVERTGNSISYFDKLYGKSGTFKEHIIIKKLDITI